MSKGLFAERGATIPNMMTRLWWRKCGPAFDRALGRRRGHLGDIWYLTPLGCHFERLR